MDFVLRQVNRRDPLSVRRPAAGNGLRMKRFGLLN